MTDLPERTPDMIGTVSRLPSGWGVIYRHFGAPDRDAVAQRLARIAHRNGLCLLIAADPALARKVKAHGVHWPARRLPLVSARSRYGLETTSAHNAAELRRAARAKVDALIVSAVFKSASPSAGPPIGLHRLLRLAGSTDLSVFALGGVDQGNAMRLATLRTGNPAGFAAVSSIHDAWESV